MTRPHEARDVIVPGPCGLRSVPVPAMIPWAAIVPMAIVTRPT